MLAGRWCVPARLAEVTGASRLPVDSYAVNEKMVE
jgi:hypothetical protein